MNAAEALYKRAIDAAPKRADILGNYALFLDKRGDMNAAEALYKRAIDAAPKRADILGGYALFLKNQRGDMDAAESFYKRAIDADPNDARNLSSFAVFLENQRGNADAALKLHQQAIQIDPENGNHLANYGELLAGLGRLDEAAQTLLSAFDNLDPANNTSLAELCISLWVVWRLLDRDGTRYERYFKFLIQKGFWRYPWSFDRMLKQAETKLSPEDLEYAKAMVSAFLDENKVAELDRFERWRKLKPLDPKPQPPSATT
jgi:Tfp pilus assembly protein PilF